jgi:hypothetical protein
LHLIEQPMRIASCIAIPAIAIAAGMIAWISGV